MNIKLRLTSSQELPQIIQLESQSENAQFIIPYTLERHQEVIENSDEAHFSLIYKNKILGFVILAGLESPHHSIEFRRIIITEKGQGWGRKSLQFVKKYCFESLNCHRLWLDVFDFNKRAQYLYQSEGFVKEGLLRECYYMNGSYRSLILMSMLKSEYFKEDN